MTQITRFVLLLAVFALALGGVIETLWAALIAVALVVLLVTGGRLWHSAS